MFAIWWTLLGDVPTKSKLFHSSHLAAGTICSSRTGCFCEQEKGNPVPGSCGDGQKNHVPAQRRLA